MQSDAPWTYVIAALPGTAWRVRRIHHLTPAENVGKHNIYVNIFKDGVDARSPNIFLRWGWDGQQPGQLSPDVKFDKQAGEPGTNIPIYKGQHIWIQVFDGKNPSDKVMNLFAEFDYDPGNDGNTIEHNSYLVEFDLERESQSGQDTGGNPNPPPSANLQQIRALAQQIINLTNNL